MKTLIYVPIIHMKADLGSLAEEVTQKSISEMGEQVWEEHTRTVEGFWESIAQYFDTLDVTTGMKIYQDSMVTDGEIGQKIVEETAKRGSKNYEILLKLIQRGAILIKTEDVKVVKEERDGLLAITGAKSTTQKLVLATKYKLNKSNILNKRDSFIAQRIKETLHEGEKGVLFIGAYHNIKNRLPEDIQIKEIKKIEKVREYHKLLPYSHKKKEEFKELERYLMAKI